MNDLLQIEGLSKRFGPVVANDGISFEVRAGEVHGVLGENGAGKSTLMNLLYGLFPPDAGRILWEGRAVRLDSPRQAQELGIGMVHQHFMLIPRLTIVENVVLGISGMSRKRLRQAAERIRELSAEWGVPLDPHRAVETLSVGERQRVEILKALYRNIRLLILDEPTASLAPEEVTQLFRLGRLLAERGGAVIFITHKLDELFAFADRTTVLRNGKKVGTYRTAELSRADFARLMVGHEIEMRTVTRVAARAPGEAPLLEIAGLATSWATAPLPPGGVRLAEVSLRVQPGEIVGIAGVDGNGQTELVEAILGLRPADQGKITFQGVDLTGFSPAERLERGLAVIPGDRHAAAVIEDFSLLQNALLDFSLREPWVHRGWLDGTAVEKSTAEIVAAFGVKVEAVEAPIKRLSGGHQQRFVIGRALNRKPELLIAVQPTRGLDLQSVEFIRRALVQLRDGGRSVLLVSMDLEEVLDLSDRVAVICGGRLIGEPSADYTREQIGLMMAGVSPGLREARQ